MRPTKRYFEQDFSVLEGRILKEVKLLGGNLWITCDDGEYLMFHEQDCCESVDLIDGFEDLQRIVGARVLSASEETSDEPQGVEDIDDTEAVSFNVF